MATQALLSRLSILGFGKETTQGTYAAPTFYVPAKKMGPEDVPTYVRDESIENNPAKLQGLYQTILDSKYAADFNMYWEAIANFLVAAGWADTVKAGQRVTSGDGHTTNLSAVITAADGAFASADVGTAITGANIPASTTIISVQSATQATMSANATATATTTVFTIGTTGQNRHGFQLIATPPSYSITDWNVFEGRGFPGSFLDTLDISIDAKAEIAVATTWMGWPSAVQSKPAPVYGEIAPGLGWEASYSFAGGAANPRILLASLSLKRNVEAVHVSQNAQGPEEVFPADADATMKIKALFHDDTERAYFISNTQPTGVITITSPTGSPAPQLVITASQMGWKAGPIDRTGKYPVANYDIDLVNNSTDNGPCQFVLVNGTATAY